MGGKWSIIARDLEEIYWQYSWYGNNFILFLVKGIYALMKYDVVELGKHG